MGYMVHHAIIVTSWDRDALEAAHRIAVRIACCLVSDICEGVTNGEDSFFVAPDGSKEGWNESKQGDVARDEIITWLAKDCRLCWAEVQYGDDNGDNRITRSSS